MRVKQFNEEVLFADDRSVKVGCRDIEFLKERAGYNERRRIRLCAHKDIDDILHEMIIVLKKDAYIRPHKHLTKTESYHIVEGLVDIVIFDEIGNIVEVVRMGSYSSGLVFYYRTSGPYYHVMLIRSDFLIFQETTNGPFKRSDTIFAPWAPEESDSAKVKEFTERVAKAAEDFIIHMRKV